MSYQSPLAVIIKGALAGAAGTAVMSAAMERAPRLMERAGVGAPEPDAPPQDPDAPQSPTEELAERMASGVLQTDLSGEARATAGEAIHWGYGAAWGAYYAVIQSTFRLPHLLHGALLGGLVYVAAATIVPRMGLVPMPSAQPMQKNAIQIGSHLVYGWATAIAYAILNLGRRG